MNNSNHRTLTVYLGGNKSKDNQTLAFAKSQGLAIREVDVTKDNMTGTQLLQLANKMQVEIHELIDSNNEEYKAYNIGGKFDQEDWLNLIIKHPEFIKTPIVQGETKAIFIDTPSDTLKVN
jgi:arsenate reductase